MFVLLSWGEFEHCDKVNGAYRKSCFKEDLETSERAFDPGGVRTRDVKGR